MNRQPKFLYPSQLENTTNRGKIYYLPLLEAKPDRAEKLMDGIGFTVGIVVILALIATAIRVVGQALWGW